MPMKNPPHPGRIVRQECIEPLGLTVTDGAKALGVSRNALSELLNERRGISPEMAIRLSKAFGSAPETWAALQLDYDMAQAMKHADQIKVRKVPQPRLSPSSTAAAASKDRHRATGRPAPCLPLKRSCAA